MRRTNCLHLNAQGVGGCLIEWALRISSFTTIISSVTEERSELANEKKDMLFEEVILSRSTSISEYFMLRFLLYSPFELRFSF